MVANRLSSFLSTLLLLLAQTQAKSAKKNTLKAVLPEISSIAEYLEDSSFKKSKKEKSVWVFFQKNCSACTEMMKQTKCYKKAGELYFVGVGSTPEKLKKYSAKYGVNKNVFYMNRPNYQKMEIYLTPTVFAYSGKDLLFTKNDIISCKSLIR